MKLLSCLLMTWGAVFALAAQEGSCPLCELHRAYNKEHPGDYEYYEDYLKAQEKETKEKPKSESL